MTILHSKLIFFFSNASCTNIAAAEEHRVMLPASVSMPPVSAGTTAKQRWQSAAHSVRFIGISQANARTKARLLTQQFSRSENCNDVVSCYQVFSFIRYYLTLFKRISHVTAMLLLPGIFFLCLPFA